MTAPHVELLTVSYGFAVNDLSEGDRTELMQRMHDFATEQAQNFGTVIATGTTSITTHSKWEPDQQLGREV